MTILLQENKEIESHITICTFGFLPTLKKPIKKTKKQFLANARPKKQYLAALKIKGK